MLRLANACCRDPRIKAAIVGDGIRLDHPDGTTVANRIPLLIYHAEPYENTPNPADAMVADSSTWFWRAYLLDDGAARTKIVNAATISDMSTAEADPGG